MDNATTLIIKQLRYRSSKLYWTYVIQYNQAERYHNVHVRLTIASLVLSGLVTSAAFISVIKLFGISEKYGNLIIFGLGIISTVLLAFITKFDYTKRIESHIESGSAIRRIWMKYQSLITDIQAGRYSTYEEMCVQRNMLRDEEYEILKHAPITLQRAYDKAEKKIHKGNHGEITEQEEREGNEPQNHQS